MNSTSSPRLSPTISDSTTSVGATTSATTMLPILSNDQLEVILPHLSDSSEPSAHSVLAGYLPTLGFTMSPYPSLFIKKTSSDIIILQLYADDIILIGSNPALVNSVIRNLGEVFELKIWDSSNIFWALRFTIRMMARCLSIRLSMLRI
ncbi:unnamed protein product [Prunus brigantina]